MGSDALAGEVEGVFRRSCGISRAGSSVAVERIAEIDAGDVFFFDGRGAAEPDFFLYGENDSDFAMRDVRFLHQGKAFQDGSNACLVIAAKNRIALGAVHAVFQDGFDATAVFHAVHVSRQRDGRKAFRIRVEYSNQAAAVSAIDRAVIVLGDFGSAQCS